LRKNIALIGFMGCGKSTIGPLLAQAIGWEFKDLDDIIEAETGRKIGEIFAEDGEEFFRDCESSALEELSTTEHLVLAGGGGVVLRKQNVERLRQNFHVIYLDLSFDELKTRLLRSKRRPLLKVDDPERRLTELYNLRRGLYSEAAHQVFAPDGKLSAVANSENLLNLLTRGGFDFEPARLRVNLAARSYQILIGNNIIDSAGRFVERLPGLSRRAVIVSNDIVGPLYRQRLAASLEKSGFNVGYIEVGTGERYKSLDEANNLYNALLAGGSDRDTLLLALGGGVVGDLVGFVASTYMRGLPLIQVPTTLLAQVDSSVGGKTAVNTARAKNSVGTFYQPRIVLADLEVLKTLPPRELKAGLAEVVKYGFLSGQEFIDLIEKNLADVLAGNFSSLKDIIYKCCAYKAAVVEEDEADRGRRAVLNYGHTIGHAIEAASDYHRYNHGEAISIGMMGAALIARKMNLIDDELVAVHSRLINAAGLPVKYAVLDSADLLKHLKLDKKRQHGKHRLVLLRGTGEPVIVKVNEELLGEVLAELREA